MTIGNSVISPFGDEFLINTTTQLDQRNASIAHLAGGGFVVSWTDLSKTGASFNDFQILSQMYHSDGSVLGGEFVVSTNTTSYQRQSSVTGLSDGGFVVVWTNWGGDLADVQGQRYDAAGNAVGQAFIVNTQTSATQYQAVVTALPNGGFVVVWTHYAGLDNDSQIRGQLYGADGLAVGAEFTIKNETNGIVQEPDVIAMANGGFAVVWEDDSGQSGDTSESAIRMQLYNADGSENGSEKLVNTQTLHDQTLSSIAVLADGRFVVVWSDFSNIGADTSGSAIRSQIFAADGSKLGDETIVNTNTESYQYAPVVTALTGGGYSVVWRDNSAAGGDSSGTAIHGQIFDASGSAAGTEFLVNTTTASNQFYVDVTELTDGRIVISWTDASGSDDDNSDGAVRGQIFDPRQTGIDLDGSALGDEFIGTAFDDTLRGGAGKDDLQGFDGNDLLSGQGGNDVLHGGIGDDRLLGGGQNDRLFGAQGDDTLLGQGGKDRLFGSVGLDSLSGGGGKDRLYGGEQSDVLQGGAGNDLLFAGSGKDTLEGGKGNDVLTGGGGKDFLKGGGGADVFVFAKAGHSKGSKADVISDYQVGIDMLDFSGQVTGALEFIGSADFTGLGAQAQVTQKANGRVLVRVDTDGDGDVDARVVLDGLSAADFAAFSGDDFI